MSWRGPMYRDPRAVVLFGVLSISTIGTALGTVPLPGSLAAAPDLYGQTAAIALCLGSAAAAVGILLPNRMDGLVIEQVGHVIAGLGAVLYALALFTNTRLLDSPVCVFGITLPISSDALIAFGMCSAIAAACLVQWWRILRFRRRLKAQAKTIADLLEK
jgi:hypothetical protein